MAQDPHWAHWDQNCERTQGVHFKKYPVGILVGTFQKNSPLTCWVTTGQIVSGLTKNSQWTHWVNSPLPPVGAPVIESTYICPFDPEGHALETAAQAWSRYNRHHFVERRDDRMKPYPEVDVVYLRSDTWRASDDTFKDLFLDDM